MEEILIFLICFIFGYGLMLLVYVFKWFLNPNKKLFKKDKLEKTNKEEKTYNNPT